MGIMDADTDDWGCMMGSSRYVAFARRRCMCHSIEDINEQEVIRQRVVKNDDDGPGDGSMAWYHEFDRKGRRD